MMATAPPTRHTYAIAALAFTAFAVYGSLVPFQFRPLPFDEALLRFSNVPYLELGIDSRADFVANILLFIPLGFLFTGALRADRSGWFGALMAAITVATAAFGLSVAIEFVQEFFPPRTVSLNDIIAETEGAAIGIAVWMVLGQFLTMWVRSFFRERERPALLARILAFYAVAYYIAQVLPLDITINLGELAKKYQQGRIILVPFAYGYPTLAARIWDYATDIVLYFPVGALTVLGWTAAGQRRRPASAMTIGIVFVAFVELCQVFIYSRYADATDLITGSVGIALGIAAATRLARAAVAPMQPRYGGLRLWPALGALAWVGILLAYHWSPFDFVVTREMLQKRLPMLVAVPFRSYYVDSEFHAFTEMSRKFMLAIPLGALLRLAWPAAQSRWIAWAQIAVLIAVSFGFFVGIELGQMFLPARIPDLTDAYIAGTGTCVGMWLANLLIPSGRAAGLAEWRVASSAANFGANEYVDD